MRPGRAATDTGPTEASVPPGALANPGPADVAPGMGSPLCRPWWVHVAAAVIAGLGEDHGPPRRGLRVLGDPPYELRSSTRSAACLARCVGRRSVDGEGVLDHCLPRLESPLVVAGERVLEQVEEALVAVRARIVRLRRPVSYGTPVVDGSVTSSSHSLSRSAARSRISFSAT